MALTIELLPIETTLAFYQSLSGGLTVHECVDDPVLAPDDAASYVAGNHNGGGGSGDSASLKIRFKFEPLPMASSITSVSVIHRSGFQENSASGVRWRAFVFVNGVQYNGALVTLGTSYAEFIETWTINPATNAPWSAADVNVLQAGVLDNNDAGVIFRRCTQLFLRVIYDSLPPNLLAMREVATRAMVDVMNPRELIEVPADLLVLNDDLMGYVDVSHFSAESVDGEGWGHKTWERHLHEVQSLALNLDTLQVSTRGLDVRLRMMNLYDTGVARLGFEQDAQGIGRLDVGGTRLFSRDSPAWVEDANGVVHAVGSNVELLEGRGMLIEQGSANFVLQSSFKNQLTGWTTAGNVVADPDETLFEPGASAYSAFFAGSAAPDAVSGLALWLESDTITQTDGTKVASWNDLSGNDYDAVQPDATRQPTVETGEINGLPVVRFAGNQFLESTIVSNLITAGACTIFVVAKASSITTNETNTWKNNCIYGDGDATDAGFFGCHLKSATPTVHSFLWDGVDKAPTGKTIAIGTAFIHTFHHAGGTLFNGKDDTRSASMSSVAAGNITTLTNGFRIGTNRDLAGRFFTGDVAALIIYNRALTEAERVNIEGFLSNKYGITAGSAAVMSLQQTVGQIDSRYCKLSIDHEDGITSPSGLGWRLQRPADSKWFRNSDQTWQAAETNNAFTLSSGLRVRDVSKGIDLGSAAPITGAVLKLVSGNARDSIHIYHVQLEGQGLTGAWASSRMLTTTATVARTLGSLEYSNTAAHTLFPAAEGGFYFQFIPEWDAADMDAAAGLPVFFDIAYSANHRWTLRYNGSVGNRLDLVARVGGVDFTASVAWTPARGVLYNIGARWTGTDGALGLANRTLTVLVAPAATLGYLAQGSVSLAALPTETLPAPFFLGSDDVTWAANGWLSHIALRPFPPSDEEYARFPL